MDVRDGLTETDILRRVELLEQARMRMRAVSRTLDLTVVAPPLEPPSVERLRRSTSTHAMATGMANLCCWSYQDPERIRDELKQWSPRIIEPAPNTVRALLVKNPETEEHFLAFRGSDNIFNWLQNLKWLLVSTRMGSVHKGFLESYLLLREGVREALSGIKYIYVTGHSLGGAQANLLMVQDYMKGIDLDGDVMDVFTFGQPRVGDSEFAKNSLRGYTPNPWFQRFVNLGGSDTAGCKDPVPYVPLEIFGYHHPEKSMTTVSKDGEIHENCKGSEDDHFDEEMLLSLMELNDDALQQALLSGFEAHSIYTYHRRLRQKYETASAS